MGSFSAFHSINVLGKYLQDLIQMLFDFEKKLVYKIIKTLLSILQEHKSKETHSRAFVLE